MHRACRRRSLLCGAPQFLSPNFCLKEVNGSCNGLFTDASSTKSAFSLAVMAGIAVAIDVDASKMECGEVYA